jgi:hypothetical protein
MNLLFKYGLSSILLATVFDNVRGLVNNFCVTLKAVAIALDPAPIVAHLALIWQ